MLMRVKRLALNEDSLLLNALFSFTLQRVKHFIHEGRNKSTQVNIRTKDLKIIIAKCVDYTFENLTDM